MAPDLDTMLASCDAGLLIGDPALLIQRASYTTVIDLAEEWREHTGKPFVFAFWAARREALGHHGDGEGGSPAAPPETVAGLAEVFQRSRDHGLAPGSVQSIAAEWAPRLGMSVADIVSYLTESIHYSLDAACQEGLRLFYDLGEECGVLPRTPQKL